MSRTLPLNAAGPRGAPSLAAERPAPAIDLERRYRLGPLIGRGGMAEVYEATEIASGQTVAVKVAAHAGLRLRFEREAIVGQEVRAPGLVAVREFGLRADGTTPYLVMDRLAGRTLGDHLAGAGSLPWRDALAVGKQLAATLAIVHARGVVHRDLKPENLFVCDGGGGALADVRVLDFGIALLYGHAHLTGSDQIVGTPVYMAPEQATAPREVDHRADLFGLGAVLYTMIAGLRAVPRRRDIEAGLGWPDIRGVVPALPAKVAALVSRAMAPKAGARYQSAGELLRAIDACLALPAGAPQSEHPPVVLSKEAAPGSGPNGTHKIRGGSLFRLRFSSMTTFVVAGCALVMAAAGWRAGAGVGAMGQGSVAVGGTAREPASAGPGDELASRSCAVRSAPSVPSPPALLDEPRPRERAHPAGARRHSTYLGRFHR